MENTIKGNRNDAKKGEAEIKVKQDIKNKSNHDRNIRTRKLNCRGKLRQRGEAKNALTRNVKASKQKK